MLWVESGLLRGKNSPAAWLLSSHQPVSAPEFHSQCSTESRLDDCDRAEPSRAGHARTIRRSTCCSRWELLGCATCRRLHPSLQVQGGRRIRAAPGKVDCD